MNSFLLDCCYWAQRYFDGCILDGQPFETNGHDYLRNFAVKDAGNESATVKSPEEARYDLE